MSKNLICAGSDYAISTEFKVLKIFLSDLKLKEIYCGI